MIEGKIIAMYACGMSMTQDLKQIKDVYGFEDNDGIATMITYKPL